MVRVGVVQAGSYVYDTPKTLEKLEKLVVEASQKGAQIVLFPEAFIGGYPAGRTFGANISAQPVQDREEFKRYFEAAIEFHGPESDKIGEIARKNNIHIVLGVIERDGTTLYCSVFFYGPDGTKLGKHRKLMPTVLERIVWGMGDGSTIPVLDTSVGKIGAVICWENYMPLLRTHMYSKGVQLYFAPTADDRETWLSNMRTFAMEGRCFVISACQFLLASQFPKDNPAYLDPQQDKILMRGGSCVVNPMGEVILEPDFTKEKVAVVDCDLSEIIAAKFDLDTVGHYSRPDVFQLIVNEKPQNNVTIEK